MGQATETIMGRKKKIRCSSSSPLPCPFHGFGIWVNLNIYGQLLSGVSGEGTEETKNSHLRFGGGSRGQVLIEVKNDLLGFQGTTTKPPRKPPRLFHSPVLALQNFFVLMPG